MSFFFKNNQLITQKIPNQGRYGSGRRAHVGPELQGNAGWRLKVVDNERCRSDINAKSHQTNDKKLKKLFADIFAVPGIKGPIFVPKIAVDSSNNDRNCLKQRIIITSGDTSYKNQKV